MLTHEKSLENFTEQFEYVLDNYKPHGLGIDDFDNIVLGGLGGSGIGNLTTYDLKGGYQPRMTVGFGLSFLTMILGELMGEDQRPVLEDIKKHFESQMGRLQESGSRIFDFFRNTPRKKFVIVSDREFAPRHQFHYALFYK